MLKNMFQICSIKNDSSLLEYAIKKYVRIVALEDCMEKHNA